MTRKIVKRSTFFDNIDSYTLPLIATNVLHYSFFEYVALNKQEINYPRKCTSRIFNASKITRRCKGNVLKYWWYWIIFHHVSQQVPYFPSYYRNLPKMWVMVILEQLVICLDMKSPMLTADVSEEHSTPSRLLSTPFL
jgi:hypothetical protein